MRSKSLTILAILAVVSVVAAVAAVYQRGNISRIAAPPDALFPGLTDRVNDVAAVSVVTPEGAFTIRKGDSGAWMMAEKSDYPVQFETIKQAVVGMASLRPLEAKTVKADKYPRLQVADPTPDDAGSGEGTLIRLEDAGGGEIAGLIVGKTKSVETSSRPGWYYVRKPGDEQSWLASGRIEVFEKATGWLDPTMIQIARTRIRAAETVQPDGGELRISRTDPRGRDFAVDTVPEGAKVAFETAPNALGSALTYISFEDVKPAADVAFDDAGKAVFSTFDGLVITSELAEADDVTWVRFSAAFDEAAVALDGLSEDDAKDMKPADEVKAEAERINARFGAWAYRLPDYKVKDLRTALSDVVTFDDKDGKS